MLKKMLEEKRRYVRLREKIKVTYACIEEPAVNRETFTEDISEQGIQILVSDKLIPQENIDLKLEFGYDVIPIIALGKVAYFKTYHGRNRAGLEFVNMDDFQKQRMERNLGRV